VSKSVSEDIAAEIQREAAQQGASSLEGLQTIARRVTDRRNSAPVADFYGLSPAEMVRLLHFPFDSPNVIDFPNPVNGSPECANVCILFRLMAEAFGENGLKATATGNLPRSLARSIAGKTAEPYLADPNWTDRITGEPDYYPLHLTRLVSGMAGLIRKANGKFYRTQKCDKLLATSNWSEIYTLLFRAHVLKYNWAYPHFNLDSPFLQQSFAFSLFLLARFGSEWRPCTFYEDRFLKAYPQILQDFTESKYSTPVNRFRVIYDARVLAGFGEHFGLAEIQKPPDLTVWQIRSTSLLQNVVRFNLTEHSWSIDSPGGNS
jgi:hypothetical protein